MRWSEIDFTPSRRTLRQFGALGLVVFGVLAVVQRLVLGRPAVAGICAVLAVAFGVIGFARPEWLRPVFVGWMVLAFPIGWTVSLILLGLVYYAVFAPVALVFRLIGRDALALRTRPGVTTYWTERPEPADVRRYFRQF